MKDQSVPLMNPEELSEFERIAGRTLTNFEAQALRREMALQAAFEDWTREKPAKREKGIAHAA